MKLPAYLKVPQYRLNAAAITGGILVIALAALLNTTIIIRGTWPLYVVGVLALLGLGLSCAAAVGFAGLVKQEKLSVHSHSLGGLVACILLALVFLAVSGLFVIGLFVVLDPNFSTY